jgi:hypothetical protein
MTINTLSFETLLIYRVNNYNIKIKAIKILEYL